LNTEQLTVLFQLYHLISRKLKHALLYCSLLLWTITHHPLLLFQENMCLSGCRSNEERSFILVWLFLEYVLQWMQVCSQYSCTKVQTQKWWKGKWLVWIHSRNYVNKNRNIANIIFGLELFISLKHHDCKIFLGLLSKNTWYFLTFSLRFFSFG